MRAKRVEPRQPADDTAEALDAPAIPAAQLTETGPTLSGVAAVFGGLVILGFLLLGASAVPPARVPWPAVAEPLFAHRSDLAALGIGTIAVAFLCLNAAVLL